MRNPLRITPRGIYVFGRKKPARICAECPCREWPGVIHPKLNAPGERPRILFVGEAPGREELIQGDAFVGPAGKLKSALLNEARLWEVPHATVNAARCSRGSSGPHKPPTQAFTHCRQFLARDIRSLAPKIVVPLGAYAARSTAALFPEWKEDIGTQVKITELDGVHFSPIGCPDFPSVQSIYPLFHPSYFQKPGRAFELQFAWDKWRALRRFVK